MSTSTINASEKAKVSSSEREQTKLKLCFGVFFDDSLSGGFGAKYSKLYNNGYKKETEKAFSFTRSLANQDFIYIWKDGELIIQDTEHTELLYEVANAVNAILHSLVFLISGYSHYDDLELSFDIYGIDNGMIAAYVLSHIIEPEEDGFANEDKAIIFSQIDKTYLSAFQELRYRRYVNHLEILNTKAAQERQQADASSLTIPDSESDGYSFNIGVTANNNQSSSLPEHHGFDKDDVNKFLDDVQTQLDLYGMVDVFGVGSVADALNVVISLGRGQWANATLSLLAVLPFIGNLASAAKGAKHIKPATKIISDSSPATKSTKTIDNAMDNVTSMEAYQEAKNIQKKVVDMDAYRQAKQVGNQTVILGTGTDGTIYNSVGGVGGSSGYFGWYDGGAKVSRHSAKKCKDSIFSEKYRVEAIEETQKTSSLSKVGDSDSGQEHAINIIIQILKWNKGAN